MASMAAASSSSSASSLDLRRQKLASPASISSQDPGRVDHRVVLTHAWLTCSLAEGRGHVPWGGREGLVVSLLAGGVAAAPLARERTILRLLRNSRMAGKLGILLGSTLGPLQPIDPAVVTSSARKLAGLSEQQSGQGRCGAGRIGFEDPANHQPRAGAGARLLHHASLPPSEQILRASEPVPGRVDAFCSSGRRARSSRRPRRLSLPASHLAASSASCQWLWLFMKPRVLLALVLPPPAWFHPRHRQPRGSRPSRSPEQ